MENYLNQALKKRFEANAIVEHLEEKIIKIAEADIYKMLANDTFFEEKWEYGFYGAKGRLCNSTSNITTDQIYIITTYFRIGKMTKAQKEIIEDKKQVYDQCDRVGSCRLNKPLWIERGNFYPIRNLMPNTMENELQKQLQ